MKIAQNLNDLQKFALGTASTFILLFLSYLACVIGNWIVAEPLKWPTAVVIQNNSTAYSVGEDGQLKITRDLPKSIFVSREGATISPTLDRNDFTVEYKGRLLWSGPITDFSSVDGQVAIVSWKKESSPREVETVTIDLAQNKVSVHPRTWISLFRGGFIVGQRNYSTGKVDLTLFRNGKKAHRIVTALDSVNLLCGLDSDGTNAVFSNGMSVTFFTKENSWTQTPGFFHRYIVVKLVDDHSFMTGCNSVSGLGGSDRHVELLSHHNARLSGPCDPRFLLIGDDARRVID